MHSKFVRSAAFALQFSPTVAGGSVPVSVLGGVGLSFAGASGCPVVAPYPTRGRVANGGAS